MCNIDGWYVLEGLGRFEESVGHGCFLDFVEGVRVLMVTCAKLLDLPGFLAGKEVRASGDVGGGRRFPRDVLWLLYLDFE